MGHVTPIFKKGHRKHPNNYRPISLTSVVGKLLESLIRDEIVDHMLSNNLFTDHQFGFVPGRACITQLLVVMEEWIQILQNGHPVDAVYLDFKKAFDSVPHMRLLNKLKAYGISDKLLDWISNFLTDRKQKVVLNGESSSWAKVISGIPQGSVLGPTLFVIFINDLPTVIESVAKIFADDTKVYGRVNNESDMKLLQDDIDKIWDWSFKWQLPFNADKCKSMHFGSSNKRHQYTINGNNLAQVKEENDLGIIVGD